MRFLIISFLLFLVATTPVFSQTPGSFELKTPDGRIVVMKADGSWEYKKESPSPSAKPDASNTATDALPPNYSGHDPKTLLMQLVDLRKRLVKSEFETSAEYETRAAEEKKKPVLGNLTIRDTFYLVVSGVTAEYDADSQSMTLFVPVEKNISAELLRDLYRNEGIKNIRDLSRISLYNISLGGYESDKVFFDDINGLMLSKKGYEEGFSAKVRLSVEEAKRLKTITKAILMVQFEEPYAVESYSRRGQFQTRLIGISFFDPQTGRVLAKMGTPPSAVLTLDTMPSRTPKMATELARAVDLYDTHRDTEALAELHRRVMIEPTDAAAYLLTARIRLRSGDQEAAIVAAKTAIFWDPKLVDAYIFLARIFFARTERAEAKKYLASALDIDPQNEEALSLRRQILN